VDRGQRDRRVESPEPSRTVIAMSFGDLISPARRAANKRIEEAIRRGLLPLDDIAFEVSLELELDEPIADDVLRALVAKAWKRMAGVKLARPTPLDRLQAAYDALDGAGIMARHYPQAGRSEAEALIENELGVAANAGRTYGGYCFYDRHLARGMSSGDLALCFGPAEPPTTYAELWRKQVDLGEAIAAAVRRQGFDVTWSGKPADVIGIHGVEWTGARDATGAPAVGVGPRLEGTATRSRGAGARRVVNVFVACAPGSEDAHRLLSNIAAETGGTRFGESTDEAAAVAVGIGDELVLDLVAAPAGCLPRETSRASARCSSRSPARSRPSTRPGGRCIRQTGASSSSPVAPVRRTTTSRRSTRWISRPTPAWAHSCRPSQRSRSSTWISGSSTPRSWEPPAAWRRALVQAIAAVAK
jgi:hypothetical protein